MKRTLFHVLTVLALASLGCGSDPPPPPPPDLTAEFKDDIDKSNATAAASPFELNFVDADGKPVDLRQYRGKKNVVLVVTRGSAGGYFCVYCSAQTASLIKNYDEFKKRDAEVLVVFPGTQQNANVFTQMVKGETKGQGLPFPLLLDENLNAVDKLAIRGDVAKPSVYILDKDGQVRFAYVGAHLKDRPTIKALTRQLDQIEKKS
jgi:peroxiredoxin